MAGDGAQINVKFDDAHAQGIQRMSEDLGTNPTDATRKAVNAHLKRLGYVEDGDSTALQALSVELARFLLYGAAVLLFVTLAAPVDFSVLAFVFTAAGMFWTVLYIGEPTFTHRYRRVVET